jgi:hypothetical protein
MMQESTTVAYPTPGIGGGQPWVESGQHGAWAQTSSRIPHKRRRRPSALPRLCRSQTCGRTPCDLLNHASMDTPTRYMKGSPPRRFHWSALSSTWCQVKDSNLRSFRDGSTDQGRQACDQRECLVPQQLPCVFPTDSRPQPDAPKSTSRSRPPPVLTTPRLLADDEMSIGRCRKRAQLSRPVYPASMTVHTTVAVLPPKFNVAKRRAPSTW